MSLLGTFIGNVGTSVVLRLEGMARLEGMVAEILGTELNDLIGSGTNVVDMLDVIKGIEEENVLVTHDIVEVTKEDEALFTTADGGIIENKGLVVAERAVDCVDHVLEFEDIGKEDSESGFKFGNSVGSCEKEGIVASSRGICAGGCSTFTGRDLNFMLNRLGLKIKRH